MPLLYYFTIINTQFWQIIFFLIKKL